MKSSRTAGPREPITGVRKDDGVNGGVRGLHTIWVLHGDDLLVVVQIVQQRCEDAPAGVQLVITHKVGVVALEGVQDERLVRLRDLEVREAAAVGQVQLGHHRLHRQTRQLRVHLDVDRLVGLHPDDQLVAGDVLEDAGGDVAELDADFGLLLVQGCREGVSSQIMLTMLMGHTLASLQDERHTIPPLVLNIGNQSTESWAARLLWHGIIFQVTRLASVQ